MVVGAAENDTTEKVAIRSKREGTAIVMANVVRDDMLFRVSF